MEAVLKQFAAQLAQLARFISPAALRVILELHAAAGVLSIPQREFAKRIGLSRSTLQAALAELVARGRIVIDTPPKGIATYRLVPLEPGPEIGPPWTGNQANGGPKIGPTVDRKSGQFFPTRVSRDHSLTDFVSKYSEANVSEWSEAAADAAKVRSALTAVFGFHVAPRDPILIRFRTLAREHAAPLSALVEYFEWIAHEKAERHYTIASAGAVYEWARAGFRNWLKRKKPPRREESSPSLSPAEEIAALEGFLRELPEHPQAASCRARLDELRGKNGARAAAGAS